MCPAVSKATEAADAAAHVVLELGLDSTRLPFGHPFVVVRCSRFNCVTLDLRVVPTLEAMNRGEMAPLSPVMHRTKQTGRLVASRRMFPGIGRRMKMVCNAQVKHVPRGSEPVGLYLLLRVFTGGRVFPNEK